MNAPETLKRDNAGIEDARSLAEEILPDAELRRKCLQPLAEAIRYAHGLGQSTWGVTRRRTGTTGFSLNVGRILILAVGSRRVWLTFDPESLTAEDRTRLEEIAMRVRPFTAAALTGYKLSLDHFLDYLPRLTEQLETAISMAAKTARQTPLARSHSNAVLAYLEAELGVELPRPKYATRTPHDLRALFEEYLDTRFDTPEGRVHNAYYPRSREEAEANFAEIKKLREAGEDATEQILLGLIPYLDSDSNRERGAWVHVAPSLNGDIRTFFEKNDWAQPDDWPRIADAVFRFVDRCVTDPDDLAAACEEFAEAGWRGFQTGTLTPILNALRPDHFATVNNKLRGAYRAITGERLRHMISSYPETNELVQAQIDEVQGILESRGVSDTLPCDAYDQFIHWVIAIKKLDWRPKKSEVEHWKIAPGESASNWDACREGGYIALGWEALGDLSGVARDEMRTLVDAVKDEQPDYTYSGANQAHKFSRIPVGSYIVANNGTQEVVGIGRTTGEYYYVSGERYGHRIPVDWFDTSPRPVDESGWRRTVVKLKEDRFKELLGGDVPLPKAADSLFSELTVDLLRRLHADPTRRAYSAMKEDFKAHVEAPLQNLLTEVVNTLPEPMRDLLETEKNLFGRIPKNDYGRGGAWDYYWGALYPKGGKRTQDCQLSVWLNHERLEIAFAFGDYRAEQPARLRAALEEIPPKVKAELETSLDRAGLSFGSQLERSEGDRFENLGAYLSESKHQETFQAFIEVDTESLPDLPASDLVATVSRAFQALFPFVLMAVRETPWMEVRQWLGLDGDEPDAPKPPYSLDDLLADTNCSAPLVQSMLRALRRKGQIVLQGPPGTGKTFVASHLARHLVGGSHGFVELVQFHPAYAYEDFMQGIRPETGPGGSLTYPLRKGRFMQFCERAHAADGPCVLIIDEINRANLARVFGELMYLLEYREKRIPLASGGTFGIPENVLLIGTMNTADRSIALVDHALRRRFAFLMLRPDYDVLRAYHRERNGSFPVENLITVLKRLNTQINDDHYEIGISFFLTPDLGDHIGDIWAMEIEPYLEEYFFDQRERVAEYRWDRLQERLGL